MNQRDEAILKSYIKLIGENAQLLQPLARLPEVLLPASRSEIARIVYSSDNPLKEQLISALDFFEPDIGIRSDMISRLTVAPFLLMLVYAISILWTGGSWIWLVISVLGLLGIAGGSIILFSGKLQTATSMNRFFVFLLYDGLWMIGFFSFGALWIRLVLYSGLYGIYSSVTPSFDVWSLLLSLLSLLVGYFFSRQLNSIYFFLYEHPKKSILRNQKANGS